MHMPTTIEACANPSSELIRTTRNLPLESTVTLVFFSHSANSLSGHSVLIQIGFQLFYQY
jgi:hypothetical protein